LGPLKPELLDDDTLLVTFTRSNPTSLSTSFTGGGLGHAKHVILRRVSSEFTAAPVELLRLARSVTSRVGIPPSESVVVFTAASVNEYVLVESRNPRVDASVLAVIGLNPPTCVEVSRTYEAPVIRVGMRSDAGTISMVVGVGHSLTCAAALDLLRTVVEAKAAACSDLLLRCESRAVGTVTDNVTLIYQGVSGSCGCAHPWAGPATEIGHEVAKAVWEAVAGKGVKLLDLDGRLRSAVGLGIEELVDEAVRAYKEAPVPGLSEGEARIKLRRALLKALKDPNVWAFLIAARELDLHGASGTIPGLSREEFMKDTVKVVADELMSLALATYVAGAKAMFSTYWVERLKAKGVLKAVKKLPMFEDDVVSALIASSLTRLYDEVLEDGDTK